MTQKSRDALLRSDRVLVAALALVLAAASAAVGAAVANTPHTDKMAVHIAAVVPAPMPLPAIAQPISLKATRGDVAMVQLLAEHRCLAEALYYEARGEGVEGQKAVAEVIFHRMRTGNYGHSICAVVYEGAGAPGCQFSFACSGELANKKSPEAWRESEVLAARILTGEERMADETGNATHFHAISVQPDWAGEMTRTVQIGNHIFYRSAPHSRAS